MKRFFLAALLALSLVPAQAEAASPLLTNISTYWTLDGNSTDSVGSKNGSDTSITYSAGNGIINSGAGLSSASPSRISFGNGAIGSLLSATSGATISVWLKPSARPGAGDRKIAFSLEVSSNNAGMIVGLIDTNKVDVGGRSVGSDGFQSVTYTDGTGTGSWIHLVGVYDYANKQISIYYNGALAAGPTSVSWGQTTFGYAATPSIPDALGMQNSNSYFDGAVDEVAVWKRKLTGTEIVALYNAGHGLQYPFIVASFAPWLFFEL
jgi:hypothetical protein